MSQRSEGPEGELQQALAYARVTMVSLAKGQPVRDLDEQLSYIDLLLSKPDSAPSARVAALEEAALCAESCDVFSSDAREIAERIRALKTALPPMTQKEADAAIAAAAPLKAHSKTQYKRLVAQGANATPPAAPSDPSLVAVPRDKLEEINRGAWSDDKTRMRLIARLTDKLLAAAPAQKGGDRG